MVVAITPPKAQGFFTVGAAPDREAFCKVGGRESDTAFNRNAVAPLLVIFWDKHR